MLVSVLPISEQHRAEATLDKNLRRLSGFSFTGLASPTPFSLFDFFGDAANLGKIKIHKYTNTVEPPLK